MIIKEWNIPIRTISEANCSEHWSKKHKRHKKQKGALLMRFRYDPPPNLELPIIIELTRLAPRFLDKHDNLPMAFKWIKDYIADYFLPGLQAGRADDSEQLNWIYNQEKSKTYSINIRIHKL